MLESTYIAESLFVEWAILWAVVFEAVVSIVALVLSFVAFRWSVKTFNLTHKRPKKIKKRRKKSDIKKYMHHISKKLV